MPGFVQSVERTLDIMELLSEHENGLPIKDISEILDLHKSTVHRLLATLIHKGYVEKNIDNNNYIVTLKLFQLGSRKVENIDLIDIAKPYLNKLAELTNEVVHLVIREGAYIVYIDKVEGTQTIRMHSRIGRRSYMYCTGVGKAIMASMDSNEMKDIWDKSKIVKLTDHTIIDFEDMQKELLDIRQRGYSLDNEENEIGVRCIAVPIFDISGCSNAALSISGPTIRMTDEKILEFKSYILEYSKIISKELGYRS